ncbi:MAG: bifunctional 3-deoxy-7-phosphoheptulonate synthase/chorismate mutase type II [Bacteroidetes bacterium]|nr:bifunctional 3-deoxy-7-phosphoheptulonate synthase/chorismate mutase type II [Bacteroidota bacterium]
MNPPKPHAANAASLILQKNVVIAGPCSAETETQVISTAEKLAATGKVHLLRAGAWKPRTSPGEFEGVGIKALPWLAEARLRTGLPFGVEVATARHAEDAMLYEADFLWIGARTTVNPFAVQQIADALRNTNVPVLVKNPVNPDVKLWAGAVERVMRAGIVHTAIIHRGFSVYGYTHHRNAPLWQLPIEMKRLFPQLPLITDPSHICGQRNSLAAVIQQAIDLGSDGLMIEVHENPDQARTDREQQLTPAQFNELLDRIAHKKTNSANPEYSQRLHQLRSTIDNIDDELFSQISDRMRVASAIGMLKQENNITVLQSSRWNEIMQRAMEKGQKLGLSESFVRTYMQALHLESIRIQQLNQ